MFEVDTQAVLAPWARGRDPPTFETGFFSMTAFKGLQESFDRSKLFLLYGPEADNGSEISGGRKSPPGLVVFDINRRCFVQQIPLYLHGSFDSLLKLKGKLPSGGTSLILVSTTINEGQSMTYFWRINVNRQGTALEAKPEQVLCYPIRTCRNFFVDLRQDVPELILMTAPEVNIVRINCLDKYYPVPLTSFFSVPGADLSLFCHAFLSREYIYFLSTSADGFFDNTHLHVLSLHGERRIHARDCLPDPQSGMPPRRKQPALAMTLGFLLLAGGKTDCGTSVIRLIDYWMLNLQSFTWMQISAQMPVPLNEPRLTVSNTGNVYLWGDFNHLLPEMPPLSRMCIFCLTGVNTNLPGYDETLMKPSTTPMSNFCASAPFSSTLHSNALDYRSCAQGSPPLHGIHLSSFYPQNEMLEQHRQFGIPQEQQLQQNIQHQRTSFEGPSFSWKCLIGLAFRNCGPLLLVFEIRNFILNAFPYFQVDGNFTDSFQRILSKDFSCVKNRDTKSFIWRLKAGTQEDIDNAIERTFDEDKGHLAAIREGTYNRVSM